MAALAASLGFDGTTAGALAVAVTEAATNIVKHATRGNIVAEAWRPVTWAWKWSR